MKTGAISVNNQDVALSLIYPKELKSKNPALIFVHGWSSNQTGNIIRAEELAKLGFICLTLDLRGHGGSDGRLDEFSRADHLKDLEAAYDYLANMKEVDHSQIGIIGASYGGYLSAILTLKRNLKWLVMRVPALYFDQDFDIPTAKLIDWNHKTFQSTNLSPKECLALKGVFEFEGKILLIESENDKVIPHETIENYLKFIDKDKLTYEVMKNAEHHLGDEKSQKEYIEILEKWFRK